MKCLSFQKKTRFKWKKLNTKYRKLLQSWLQKKIFIKGDSQGNANSSAVCLTLRCRNGMDGFTDRLSLYRLGRKGCGDAVTSLRLRLGSRDAALLVKSADMRMPVRERWQYMCSAALEPLEKNMEEVDRAEIHCSPARMGVSPEIATSSHSPCCPHPEDGLTLSQQCSL